MTTTASPEVRQVIEDIKALVDEHWAQGAGMHPREEKTCLLGLVCLALGKGRFYSEFDYPGLARDVVDYMDQFIPPVIDDPARFHPYQRLYVFNDAQLSSAAHVHAFLDRLLEGNNNA